MLPDLSLEGRNAIVTGAGRGIGRAIALVLAEAGASIVATARTEPEIQATASSIREMGGNAISILSDVSDSSSVDSMVSEAQDRLGNIDIMVNNAGVLSMSPALDIEASDWDRHFAVNTKGVLFCSQAAGRQMLAQGDGGRIICIVSTAGRLPSFPDTPIASYVASKHATMGLIQQMSQELAPHGILMNAVFPGIVDGEMLRSMHRTVAAQTGETYEQVRERVLKKIPVGRYQTPADVANVVAFLASSDANYSVGQVFDVNGGAFFW